LQHTKKLLALDMDGTLLRKDGAVSPLDEGAIREAVRAGIHVAICTGRVSTGAVSTARKLDLETAMICADGGVFACPRTARKLSQSPIALEAAEHAAHIADESDMASFVFLHHEIHADARGERWLDYVRTWTPDVFVHARLAHAANWRSHDDVAVVLSIGPREQVEANADVLRAHRSSQLDLATWRAGSKGEHWALMARPAGVNKGTGLALLAEQLGVAREDVCAVGDWFNDVPMFGYAGRSFAMGQSVPEVRAHATDALHATSETGGGVAEAIERWLR
jgi:Cof subfamily protein (haloacid dehalogenase superfamily)